MAKLIRTIKLRVIPEPAEGTRSVLVYTGEGTVIMRGDNPTAPRLLCGGCSAPLTIGVPRATLTNMVLKCHACGAYNET